MTEISFNDSAEVCKQKVLEVLNSSASILGAFYKDFNEMEYSQEKLCDLSKVLDKLSRDLGIASLHIDMRKGDL